MCCLYIDIAYKLLLSRWKCHQWNCHLLRYTTSWLILHIPDFTQANMTQTSRFVHGCNFFLFSSSIWPDFVCVTRSIENVVSKNVQNYFDTWVTALLYESVWLIRKLRNYTDVCVARVEYVIPLPINLRFLVLSNLNFLGFKIPYIVTLTWFNGFRKNPKCLSYVWI